MAGLLCKIIGHKMEFAGGRPCPRGHKSCLQSVYECVRCHHQDDSWSYAECNSRMLKIGDFDPCPLHEEKMGRMEPFRE